MTVAKKNDDSFTLLRTINRNDHNTTKHVTYHNSKQVYEPRFEPVSNDLAKKDKFYVSKLVTDWKTWPKCGFFFFFFFFWAADVSDLSRSQLCSVWNMELDFWMNKIQDRTQIWSSLMFKVFYWVCHNFSCIFCQAN